MRLWCLSDGCLLTYSCDTNELSGSLSQAALPSDFGCQNSAYQGRRRGSRSDGTEGLCFSICHMSSSILDQLRRVPRHRYLEDSVHGTSQIEAILYHAKGRRNRYYTRPNIIGTIPLSSLGITSASPLPVTCCCAPSNASLPYLYIVCLNPIRFSHTQPSFALRSSSLLADCHLLSRTGLRLRKCALEAVL